jgi:hypothetical protein
MANEFTRSDIPGERQRQSPAKQTCALALTCRNLS